MRYFSNPQRSLALLVATVLLAASAWAQPQPQAKTVRMLIAFPPGGPVDFVGRALAEGMAKELGQPVMVENRAGGNGAVAAEAVIRAPADGSTVWLTSVGAVAINPALYDKLPYDPPRDLAPVSLVVNNVEVLVVNSKSPWATGADMVAAARTPGNKPLTMASSGTGSVPHLAAEQLSDAAKIDLVHVPYKGAAPALNDVMAGHVSGFFGDIPGLIGFVRSGQLRPIGIAAAKRHPLLPEVKTFEEMGIKGMDSDNWYALFTTRGTPAAEVERLNKAVRAALASEPIRSKLTNSGAQPAASSPAELAALLKSDSEKWARMVRAKNIKPD